MNPETTRLAEAAARYGTPENLPSPRPDGLRLALIVGGLTHGGAEKQLVYMAQSLRQVGVDVRVFGLTQGEYYQARLEDSGIPYLWVGGSGAVPLRVAAIIQALRAFRPQIVQSTHFFTNLYAAIAGRLLGIVDIGSVRSNVFREVQANGRWGPYLLRGPQALILNSEMARQNALSIGLAARRLFVLPNVINLEAFDRSLPATARDHSAVDSQLRVITVARLVKAKRLDRLIAALALARQSNPALQGVIVGEGPERQFLEAAAAQAGLLPDGVAFLGLRSDIPTLLSQAGLFVLSSETEGFPNAILEAMAARLPVITTPAGDAPHIIHHEVTGFLVPHDDPAKMSARILQLAGQPELRERMGAAGRARTHAQYSIDALAGRLLAIYHQVASQQRSAPALRALSALND